MEALRPQALQTKAQTIILWTKAPQFYPNFLQPTHKPQLEIEHEVFTKATEDKRLFAINPPWKNTPIYLNYLETFMIFGNIEHFLLFFG